MLPAARLLAVPLVASGPPGRYQGALVVLLAAAGWGAFTGLRAGRASLLGLGGAAGAALVHALLGASPAQALALALLAAAVGAASGGLARLGRALGAPSLPAGAVAFGVLLAGMQAIHWGDAFADALPRRARHRFQQAVLHVDPALAAAYDAAGHDRLREPALYSRLDLAAALLERPRAVWTAGLWLGVGLLAAGAAWGLGPPRGGRKGGRRGSPAGRVMGGGRDAGALEPPPTTDGNTSRDFSEQKRGDPAREGADRAFRPPRRDRA